jgi:hypothetical protein
VHCNGEHTLSSCSLLGDKFDDATCSADTACDEDGANAACVPLVCPPASVRCAADKGSVVTCSDDGLSVKNTEPCGVGQACVDAQCKDVVCPPGDKLCDGNVLSSCDASGTVKTTLQTCSGINSKCDAALGKCKPPACAAGVPLCDGEKTTVCAEDGSGPAPNGTPCADGTACYGGSCLANVCKGAYQCSAEGVLFKCTNNGTGSQIWNDCGAAGLCDAAGVKCLSPKCSPGAFVCDGNIATRCKADGSAFEPGGTDCAATNLVCDGGGCLPKVCTPSATSCLAGSPISCSASGATYAPSDTCQLAEYCSPASQFCLADKCTANAAVCNGNLLTTCAADGSGPVAGGTDCSASGQVCNGGACKPVVCTKGALSCQGEAVYACNDSGTGTGLYQSCALSQYCDASGTPTCATDICIAGALGCSQEVVSTCGSNGGSWITPGTNCATSGQVCVLGGTCAAQEVAVAGAANSYNTYSNTTNVTAFRALSARKLTQIEVNASVVGLQKFTWVVYQKRTNSEVYDLVYQSVTAQAAPVTAWLSSGALNYTLSAGKTYAVGVHITGYASVTLGYGYGAYLPKASFLSGLFNSTLGSNTQPGATANFSAGGYYSSYLRFTTVVTP